MDAPSIADLPWLPAAPDDFAGRCAAVLAGSPGPVGSEMQALASHRLDARQGRRFARALAKAASAGAATAPLSPFRLTILANATFDLVADHLPVAAARHGVLLELVLPPFDQAMQQALDPASETSRAKSDAILAALDQRWFGLDRPSLGDPDAAVAEATGRLTALLDALARNTSSTVILSTLAAAPISLFGSYDARVAGSPRSLVDAFNRALVEIAAERGALVLDVATLAGRVGLDQWCDPVAYAAYKLPFAARFDAIYADTVGRMVGAMRGKARKCLVLDLDNTLWGGAVGDEGVEGVVLGHGSAQGESFLAVQQLAVDLRARGVILAVSSKNDDQVAREAFRTHPEMILQLEHLAVFQANWQDKASNLEAIAKTLNLGLEALVLLDDNPAERAQVRAALPAVAIPELPDDPAWFPWFLAGAGYFETVAFSDEDRLRATSYANDARRAEVKAGARDLGDYLSSLEMRLAAGPFDAAGRARISQLINKTNQFNLTTRRYGEVEVAAMEADPAMITMQVRLSDRFGDLGMIAVVIARLEPGADGSAELNVDSWLMSCRVLGRKVEEAMLTLLLERATAAGAARVRAEYRPTAKNAMVRELFDGLGFQLVEETVAGVRRYVREVGVAVTGALPLEIVRAEPWPAISHAA